MRVGFNTSNHNETLKQESYIRFSVIDFDIFVKLEWEFLQQMDKKRLFTDTVEFF